ncbi:MAG TPA: type II secretion system protein [Phycisphaerae bacterium]|nr:type II secretion system protein [Phycisphaerae bacterium]
MGLVMKDTHISNKGFTLIELLVVISIIALLVSIIMPSLGTARQLAQRVACSATLKGIGNAWAMYLDTNNRCMPYKDTDGESIELYPYEKDSGNYNIMVAMKDYVGEGVFWKCPSIIGSENYQMYGSSYEYVMTYMAGLMDDVGAEFFRINAEHFPDKIPIFYDAQSDAGEAAHASKQKPDGQNHMFNDSHVEYASWDDISDNLNAIKSQLSYPE